MVSIDEIRHSNEQQLLNNKYQDYSEFFLTPHYIDLDLNIKHTF